MWKWWICLILLLATVLNYLDRQTMALCAPRSAKSSIWTMNNMGHSSPRSGGLTRLRRPCRLSGRSLLGAHRLCVSGCAMVDGGGGRRICRQPYSAGLDAPRPWTGRGFQLALRLRVTANLLPPKDRGLGNGIFASGAAAGASWHRSLSVRLL